ncbi:uncharacterized protein LOC110452381 [Mizuhopecten yessoensis]|uniref:uncharacterized protein LOC110452381 n=1 Tax=Mizuhopecten yessoensis TaxID=6573 RepID=UPI000B458170|nr:uncharacterized protein LOC110452381 [Mizuhopecten yessoensis]
MHRKMEDYKALLILLFVCLASFNGAQRYLPSNLTSVYVADGTIRVSWDPPTTPGRSDGYSVAVLETGEYGYVSTDHCVYQYNNTRPATTYSFELTTIISATTRVTSQTTITTPTAIYRQRSTGTQLMLPKPPGGLSSIIFNGRTLFAFFDNDNIGGNNRTEYGVTVRVTSTKTELTFDRLKTEHAGYYYTMQQSGNIILGGQMLVVTDTPTRPNITLSNSSPVLNTSVRLVCSSASRSQPDNHGLVLTASWKLNGSALNHARFSVNDSSLTINAVRFRDKYNVYACVAHETGQGVSGLTSEESGAFTLTPRYGPQFITIESTEGKSSVIRGDVYGPVVCRTDCNPACLMEWRRQGIPFIPSRRDSSNELELVDASLPRVREVTYACQVQVAPSAGFTTPTLEKNITVIVYYRPQFVTIESNEDKSPAIRGDVYGTVSCRTDCNPSCLMEWRRQGIPFIPSCRDSSNELELVDPSLPRVREVTYTCQVEVAPFAGFTAPTLEKNITVIVYFAPQITELRYRDGVDNQYMHIGSNEVRYTEGSSLELRVDVDSSPLADVTLLRNQTTLVVGVPVSTGIYEIKLHNLQCNHTGKYDVWADNFVTRNRSTANAPRMQFGLQVSCAPRIYNTTNTIISITGERGQIVVLNVTVIANPMPTIQWSDEVRALGVVQNNDNMYTVTGLVRITTQSDFQKCYLNVTNTLPEVLTVLFQISLEEIPQKPYTQLNLIICLVSIGVVVLVYVVVIAVLGMKRRQRQQDQTDASLNQNTQGNTTSLELQSIATTHGRRINGDDEQEHAYVNVDDGIQSNHELQSQDDNEYIEINPPRGKTDAKLSQNTQGNTTSLELQSRATIHGRRNNGDEGLIQGPKGIKLTKYQQLIPNTKSSLKVNIVDGWKGGAIHNDDNSKHTYLELTGDDNNAYMEMKPPEGDASQNDETDKYIDLEQTRGGASRKDDKNKYINLEQTGGGAFRKDDKSKYINLEQTGGGASRKDDKNKYINLEQTGGGASQNDDTNRYINLEQTGGGVSRKDDKNKYINLEQTGGGASRSDEKNKYIKLEQTGGQEHVYDTTHPEHRDSGAIGERKGRASKDKKRRHTPQQ